MSQPTFPQYSSTQPTAGAGERDLRREAEAAVATRRDLGPEYDEAIAAGLADKVEQLVAYRTAELRARSGQDTDQASDERLRRNQRFTLGIISLGAGVPITAIAAINVDPGALGVMIAWAGIVGVNLAAAWNGRRRG